VRHRRDIEGLRAFAVVAVLLYHFGVPGTSGGFIGVDVFFVISGYLITSLLISERETRGRIMIRGFYARRARRLLPISAVVLAATAVCAALWLDPTRLQSLASDIRAAALFSSNLVFADRGTDYLGQAMEPSPLLHYWSLAVEEQFYLVWPALIALVTWRAARVRRNIAVAMAVIVAGSYAASVVLTPGNPSWSYYGLHTRAWELGLGALLAAVTVRTARIPGSWRAAFGWAGLAVIAVSTWAYGHVEYFPGWVAVFPVVATGAVLVAGDDLGRGPTALLRARPLQWIGSRSYSLYLWHWPALIIAGSRWGEPLTAVERWGLLALVVVVAELGYRLVEHPVRSAKPLVRSPRASLSMGLALILVGVGTSTALGGYDPDLDTGVVATSPTVATTSSTVPEVPDRVTNEDAVALDVVRSSLAVQVMPDNLRPPAVDAFDDTGLTYRNNCHVYGRTSVRKDCIFGDPTGEVTIALWGDSHAAQWFPALEDIAVRRGWRLVSMTQGGCPVLDILTYNTGSDRDYTQCKAWQRSARKLMLAEGVDAVFLTQFYNLRDARDRERIQLKVWNQELPPLLASIKADGIEPIVFGEVPLPRKNVPSCLTGHRKDIQFCAAEHASERVLAIDEAIRRITAEQDAGYIEPWRWLCVDTRCPPIVGDILIYRDDNHLTATFSKWMGAVLEPVIAPFVESLPGRSAAATTVPTSAPAVTSPG